MARKPRIHLPGAYHHVMMHGNGESDIFSSAADRTRFLLLLQEGVERYGHRIHAFCLMSNHVHLLIQVATIPLPKIIQNLGFRYAQYFNHQRQTVGHLFQGRYKTILVDADSYLLELARYIHLNPVRAGLCEYAEGFEWSSHCAYMGLTIIPWLHTQEILSRFSADVLHARELFNDFVVRGDGQTRRFDFHHGTHMGLILGDDHFADQVIQASNTGLSKQPTLDEILCAISTVYGIDIDRLYEPEKNMKLSEARAMAAIIIQEIDSITLTSLAKELGRDLSTLSQSAGRLRKRIKGNKALQEIKERVEKAINIHRSQA